MTYIIFNHHDAVAARRALDTLVKIGDESGISEFGDQWDNALDVIRRTIDDAEGGLESDAEC